MPFFPSSFCNQFRRQTTVRTTSNNFIFSAVQAHSTINQTVAQNEEVVFDASNVNTGVSFTFAGNTSFVNVVASGVYKISFVGTVTANEKSNISLAIATNQTPQVLSNKTQTVNAGEFENVNTELVIKVVSPSMQISVINTGTDEFIIQNATLSIVRVGDF
jgi:hypothetical protein